MCPVDFEEKKLGEFELVAIWGICTVWTPPVLVI